MSPHGTMILVAVTVRTRPPSAVARTGNRTGPPIPGDRHLGDIRLDRTRSNRSTATRTPGAGTGRRSPLSPAAAGEVSAT
jgi:hypothetical protein